MHDHVPHVIAHERHAARPAASPAPGALSGPSPDREVVRTLPADVVRRTVAEVRAAQARRRRAALMTPGVETEPSEQASPEVVRLLAQLRTSLTVHVCRLRADGLPPEQVLSRVKAMVREAESPRGTPDTSEQLMAQVVRWTIEAYFDEPELQGSPRFF